MPQQRVIYMAETRVRNRRQRGPTVVAAVPCCLSGRKCNIIRPALEVRQHSQHAHRSGLDGWEDGWILLHRGPVVTLLPHQASTTCPGGANDGNEPIASRTYSVRRREILECRPPKGRKKFRPGAISWGRRRMEDEPSRSPYSATIPSPQCTLRSQCGRLGDVPGLGLAGLDWLR